MEDRSEKIVTLAREMLAQPAGFGRPAPSATHAAYTLKTVALAAMLGAAGASGATAFSFEQLRPINRYERIELVALIHYAAHTHNSDKDSVQADFFNRFGIAAFNELSHAQMDEARAWLRQQVKQEPVL